MTEEVPKHAAAWSEADDVVRLLRRELAHSSSDTDTIAAAFERLDRALSTLCASQRAFGEATAAAPSGPVAAPDTRPDPSERALRERLTMQTHRPAAPIGTSPPSDTKIPGQGSRDPCAEAFAAAAIVRAAADRSDPSGEQALQRLETALGGLRAARP